MKGQDLQYCLIETDKNPHFIDDFSNRDLFDFMSLLRQDYEQRATFLTNYWIVNESQQVVSLENWISENYNIKVINRVYAIVEQKYKDNTTTNTIDAPTPNDTLTISKNRIVMLLNELGIFNYLMDRYPKLKDNETALCELAEKFTGIGKGTIRPTYRAIIGTSAEKRNDPYKTEANLKWLENEMQKLK
jgi:hypothetical protein